MLGKAYLSAGWFSGLTQAACTINSSGALATDWVQVLEALTLRSDLRYLTLLTWNDILTPVGLVRSTKAWCSACFEEWHIAGHVVYEPLLWTLQVVTVCPHHHRRLEHRCPHVGCNRLLPWLARRAQPGYCSYCEKWLGTLVESDPEEDERLDEEGIAQQNWVAENVGELITIAPWVLSPPLKQRIARVVTCCIERVTSGNLSAFARMLRIPEHLLKNWRSRNDIPTLSNLLRLCYGLGISLRTFLLEEEKSLVIDSKVFKPWSLWDQYPKKDWQPLQLDTIQGILEAALAREPPPPLEEVAKQLGYRSPRFLYDYFSDLTRAISARYLSYRRMERQRRITQLREQVREGAIKLHTMGIYPGKQRFAEQGVKMGYFRNPEIQAVWHEVLRELGYEK